MSNKNMLVIIPFLLTTSTSITPYHWIIHPVSIMVGKIPSELENLIPEAGHRPFGYFIADA